jgi:hypothetical protein
MEAMLHLFLTPHHCLPEGKLPLMLVHGVSPASYGASVDLGGTTLAERGKQGTQPFSFCWQGALRRHSWRPNLFKIVANGDPLL